MDTPEEFTATRLAREATFVIEAPRALVFPLLCPVRERDWLPGWQADVVFSHSGLVEDGCLFRSRNPKLGEGLYVTSRHEPEAGIVEFVVFYPGILVMKLDIVATAEAQSTTLRWRRTYTALGPEGRAFIAGLTEDVFNQQMDGMRRALADHCRRLHAG
jgi:hypothetical protein